MRMRVRLYEVMTLMSHEEVGTQESKSRAFRHILVYY